MPRILYPFSQQDRVFGFAVPGMPAEIWIPRNTWADKGSNDATAKKLAGLFRTNLEKYSTGASAEVKAAGPTA
jgi:phosphoenolpyruvate carboxykinase (ATP)